MQLVKSTIGLKERKVLPKIIMVNGGYYEGEWLNGLRDGTGKHVIKNKLLINSIGRKVVITKENGKKTAPKERGN